MNIITANNKRAKGNYFSWFFFISLSINFIISSNSEETILYFDNINAIAEKESGDDFTPTCIKAGYLCTGIDKNGNIGTFDGLSIDMD